MILNNLSGIKYKPQTYRSNIIKIKSPGHQTRAFQWCGAGSNRRHKDFQSFALPTELPHLKLKNSKPGNPKFQFWDLEFVSCDFINWAAKIIVLSQRLKTN